MGPTNDHKARIDHDDADDSAYCRCDDCCSLARVPESDEVKLQHLQVE